MIDDGSTDGTLDIIREHNLTHISFEHNRGKGAALCAAFDYALLHGYRSVLTLDADLQHSPEEIPQFYALDDGCRLVLGTRRIRGGNMPFSRRLSNNLTSIIVSIFFTRRVRDSQSGFRLIPTSLLRAIELRATDFDLESEMLFKAGMVGCDVAEAEISTLYGGRVSYIRPLHDTGRFIRQIWRRVWA
jgi:glycosyltransferase involved in cell wall biosynthesis